MPPTGNSWASVLVPAFPVWCHLPSSQQMPASFSGLPGVTQVGIAFLFISPSHLSPTDGKCHESQILKEPGLNLATAGALMAVTLKETFDSLPAF